MGDREFDNEEILTARLSLRRPTPADIDAIYSIHRDERACAHNPTDLLTTRADAEDLFRRWDEHWRRHGFGYWTIRGFQAVEPLGFCGIARVRPDNAASRRVAARAGLHRAEPLDCPGEDGLDWIFTSTWSDRDAADAGETPDSTIRPVG